MNGKRTPEDNMRLCPPEGPALFTIGHSTRPIEEFLAMLRANTVDLLIDVRTVPKSRHNPQFTGAELAQSLPAAGIEYHHEPALGGLRHAARESVNGAWRNASFRGYADYMQTPEFETALQSIIALGAEHRLALMCAEGNPFRCHRTLLADALFAHGIASCEITASGRPKPHRLTPFAHIEGTRVTYPSEDSGPSAQDSATAED
jgi:uncharacterized protein (DUF488 family)